MANADRIFHDPETGQLYLQAPGNKMVPVDEGDLATIQEGGLQTFLKQAAETAARPLRGAAMVGSSQGLGQQREAIAQEDRAAEIRQIQSPGAALAGNVVGYAPDLAMGIATGGAGGLAKGTMTTMLAEGTLGALRNPNDPAMGALMGATLGGAGNVAARVGGDLLLKGAEKGMAIGNRVVAGSRARSMTEGINGPPGSVSGVGLDAQQGAANRGMGERISGFFNDKRPDADFIARADDLGYRLTPGMRQGSAGMRQLEARMESQPGGGAAFDEIREANSEVLKADLVRGMGGEGTDMRPEALGKIKDNIGGKFRGLSQDMQPTSLDGIKAPEINDPVLRDRIEGLVENLKGDKGDKLTGEELYNRISDLRKDADAQWLSPSGDRQLGKHMDKIADDMEELFIKNIDDPAAASILKEAKEEWRLLRTLERGKAVTTDGDVNPVSIDSALRNRYGNEYRYGKGAANPNIDRALKSARTAYEMRDTVGNSGTATRSGGNLLSNLTTTPIENIIARSYLGSVNTGSAVAATAGAGATAYGAGTVLGAN